MSNESFAHLLRLTGAAPPPAPALYDDSWPGVLRRGLQTALNALELLRSRGTFVAVEGAGVAVATGLVRAGTATSMRALLGGARVLRGGRLARLADQLAIDSCSQLELFLATEDVLIVFGERSGKALAIHVSANDAHLERQKRGMETAREVLAQCPAADLVPRLVERRQIDGAWALIQKRLVGRNVDPAELSATELETYIEAALGPLLYLDSLANTDDKGPDHEIICAGFRSIEMHPVLAAQLAHPLAALRNWSAERRQWRMVFAHGDYWFQNLLFAKDGSPVLTGILDWERCRTRALPGADALYLVAFAFSRWHGCPQFKVLCDIWDGACDPLLERLVDRLLAAFRISIDDLRFIAILMWLMHLRLRVPWMTEWPAARHQEWITLPVESIGRWLSRRESSLDR
jgi:hypothetical protein